MPKMTQAQIDAMTPAQIEATTRECLTNSRRLLDAIGVDITMLKVELADAIFIPNSYLPERYHGSKEYVVDAIGPTHNGEQRIYGRSVASLWKDRNYKLSDVRYARNSRKQEKLSRVVEYEKTGTLKDKASPTTLTFIEDEDKLYRAQVTFAKLLGLFDEE